LPRKAIAAKSLYNSFTIIVANMGQAVDVSNNYAPEHLIIQTVDPRKIAAKITQAGSVFLGKWSPESVGDYASGTNHVLPTYGYAKCFSGIGVSDFMTQITFQELSKQGLQKIAFAVEQLAETEGLIAHKRAVSIRLGEK
jgi:histidinol dehydrogenase